MFTLLFPPYLLSPDGRETLEEVETFNGVTRSVLRPFCSNRGDVLQMGKELLNAGKKEDGFPGFKHDAKCKGLMHFFPWFLPLSLVCYLGGSFVRSFFGLVTADRKGLNMHPSPTERNTIALSLVKNRCL